MNRYMITREKIKGQEYLISALYDEKKHMIEVFIRDGQTVGESICDQCGFAIPGDVHLSLYLEEVAK